MIEKLDIEGVHLEVDDNIRRYVIKKVGRLDKFLPKHARESAHAEILLKMNKGKDNPATCEVTLYLPKETINVKESTVSIFAAIDIVEAKLKNRLQKYKQKHSAAKIRRHLLSKIRQNTA